jgi:hypothetical protein
MEAFNDLKLHLPHFIHKEKELKYKDVIKIRQVKVTPTMKLYELPNPEVSNSRLRKYKDFVN